MKHRSLAFLAGLATLVSLAQGQVAPHTALATSKTGKQTPAKSAWTPPRTADGHPDLQGFWANNTATPLERPQELAGREFLTDAELAAMKKKAKELFSGQGDAAFGDDVFNTVLANVLGKKSGFKSVDGETGDYSSVWTVERVWDNRTSLITNPSDGRLPPMTAEGLARRAANLAAVKRSAGPEDRSLSERCVTYGSPQIIAGYQSYYQVVQSPKTVVLATEMIHDSREISLDGSPHIPSTIQLWHGDSRGRWEGDTLVVDTTNYKQGAFFRGASSEELHVTERFTRTAPDTLRYEVTIDDPGTWAKPWTLMIPWQRSPKPVYEYACHEGNIGLAGILAGARADERAAGQK
jgi:hypothetical protein